MSEGRASDRRICILLPLEFEGAIKLFDSVLIPLLVEKQFTTWCQSESVEPDMNTFEQDLLVVLRLATVGERLHRSAEGCHTAG